jgi:hypothetical protein
MQSVPSNCHEIAKQGKGVVNSHRNILVIFDEENAHAVRVSEEYEGNMKEHRSIN